MSSNAVSTQTSGPGVRVVLPEAQRYRQLLEAEEQADLVAQNEAIRQALSSSSKKRGSGEKEDRNVVVGDVEDEAAAKQLQVGASLTRAESRQNRMDCAASDATKGCLPEAAGTDWLRSTNAALQRPATSHAGGGGTSYSSSPQRKSSLPSSYISPDRRGSGGGGDRGWAQGTRGLRIAYGAPSLKDMLAEQAGIMRPSTAPQPIPTSTSNSKTTSPTTTSNNVTNIRSLSPLKESIRLKSEDGGKELFTKERDDRMKAVLAQHDATRTSVTEKYRRAAEERRAQREAADAAYVEQSLGTSAVSGGGASSSLCASYMTSKKEEADVWGRPAGITAEDDILALEHQKQEKRKLRKNAKKERREQDVNRHRRNDDEVSSTSSEEDENGHCRTYAEKVAEREAARLERLNQVTASCNTTSGGTAETRREYFDVGQRLKQAKEDAARARRANIATSAITKAKDHISAGTSLRELLGISTPTTGTPSDGSAAQRPGSSSGGAFSNSSPSKGAPLQLHSPSANEDGNETTVVDPDMSAIVTSPDNGDVNIGGSDVGVVALADEYDDNIDKDALNSHQRPPSSLTNRSVELRLENFGVKESHGVVNTIFGFSPPASRQRMTTHTPVKATSRLATQIAQSRAHTAPIPEDGVGSNGADGTRATVSALGIDRAGASTPSSSLKRVAWSDQNNHAPRAQTTTSGAKAPPTQQSQPSTASTTVATTAPLTDQPSTAPFAAKVRLTAKPNPVSTDPSYPSVSAGHPDPSPIPATSGTYGTLRPPSTREELERARTPAIYIPISNSNHTNDGSSILRDPDTGLLIDTNELDLTPAELRDKRRHDAEDASRLLSASAAEALRSSRRRMGNITDRAAAAQQQQRTQLQEVSQLQPEEGDGYVVVDGADGEEDTFEGVSVPAGVDDGYDDELFPRPDTAHRQDHSDICGASGDELPTPTSPMSSSNRRRSSSGGDENADSSSFVTLKEQRRNEAAAAAQRLQHQQGPVIETSVDSAANNKKHALRPLDEMKLELEVSAMTDELRRRQEDKRKLVHSRESVTSARKDRSDAVQQQVQDLKDEAMNLEGDLADEKRAYRDQYLKEKDTKANSWRQPFVPKHISEWEAESAAIQKKARDAAALERGETITPPPKVVNRLIPSKGDDSVANSAADSKIATGDEIAEMDMETRAGYALMREAAIQRLESTTEPTFRHAVHNHENTEFLILWQLWHDTVCGEMESRVSYEHEEQTYRRALQNYAHSSFSKAEEMQHMPEMLRDLLAPPASSLGGFHGGTRPSSSLHQRRPPSSPGSNREVPAASSSPVRAGGGRAGARRLSDTLTQYDNHNHNNGVPSSGGDSPTSSRNSNLPPLSPQRRTSTGDASASSPQHQQHRRPSSSSARASSPGAATTTGHHIETIQLVEECNVLREELLTYSRDKLKWKQEKRKLRQEYLTMCIERGIRPFADVYVDESGHAHFVINPPNPMLTNSSVYGDDSDASGVVDRLSMSESRHNNATNNMSSASGRLGGTTNRSSMGSLPTEEIVPTTNNSNILGGDSSPTNHSDFDHNSRPPSRAITDLDDDVAIHMMNSRPGTGVGLATEIHTPQTAAAGAGRISGGGRLGDNITDASTHSRPSTIPTPARAAEVDPILALRRRLEIVQWSVDDTEQRELMAKKRLGDLSTELASSH